MRRIFLTRVAFFDIRSSFRHEAQKNSSAGSLSNSNTDITVLQDKYQYNYLIELLIYYFSISSASFTHSTYEMYRILLNDF